MLRASGLMLPALLWMALVGCSSENSSAPETQPAAASTDQQAGPDVAVFEFLKAVQTGDDQKAALMLTKVAREKTAEMEMVVAPPGSETASFEVGEVQLLNESNAYVSSTWTDVGEDGQPHSDQIVWVTRRDPEGWRIAGMVTKFLESKLVLNFEDPADMLRKQQLAEQEMMRRAQQQMQGAAGAAQQQQLQQPPTEGPAVQAQQPRTGEPVLK